MSRSPLAVLVLVALPLAVPSVAAPIPKELKAVKTDAEQLVGTWIIVSSNHHNKDSPGSVGIRYVFKGDGTCMIIHQNNSQHGPVKVGFDEKANPKTYSWVTPWGTWKGVYELSGDTLKMAAVGDKNGQPPAGVGPGQNVEYSELKREK